jgi:hypothetical protein
VVVYTDVESGFMPMQCLDVPGRVVSVSSLSGDSVTFPTLLLVAVEDVGFVPYQFSGWKFAPVHGLIMGGTLSAGLTDVTIGTQTSTNEVFLRENFNLFKCELIKSQCNIEI